MTEHSPKSSITRRRLVASRCCQANRTGRRLWPAASSLGRVKLMGVNRGRPNVNESEPGVIDGWNLLSYLDRRAKLEG